MLKVVHTDDVDRLKRQIAVLEWQLEQDITEKERERYAQTLWDMKMHLEILTGQGRHREEPMG